MENDKPYSTDKLSAPNDLSAGKKTDGYTTSQTPPISLPKSGGSIRSIDEKFSVNTANGTAGFNIPFPYSPSRNGFMPQMTLRYDSGGGNDSFGMGWSASPPAITRKTGNKLPEYRDDVGSDTFLFSGAEDLVPTLIKDDSGNWTKDTKMVAGTSITRYRPRIEAGYARIEHITEPGGNNYWKVTTGQNQVSVFGRSLTAQIADPADPSRIYKWLLEFSYDDKGNCYQLEYKPEDHVNVQPQLHEKNRLNGIAASSNTYLKYIKYCNKKHFNRDSLDLAHWDAFLQGIDYLLELVLDYGEHDADDPQPADDKGWSCRTDAFSDYRAGFEIRSWRLCRRLLMFHHFSELGAQPCLVRSMDMDYDSNGAFTFLRLITEKGYIRKDDGSWSVKSLPPLEFGYEPLGWDTEVRSLPPESLENLPGINDNTYHWTDLYNEGLSGILTEQAGGWYYKSNAGGGKFDSIQLVSPRPSGNGQGTSVLHLRDLEGNGRPQLVSDDLEGYFDMDPDNNWLPFHTIDNIPNVDLRNPNVKMLDLNGDGKADILITEEEVFTWYPSKGKEGFGPHQRQRKERDEEKGPALVFADDTQSIVLADMSGDSLLDIVRIRCNEIVYWPNLGYGKFGAKISMSNAPVLDRPENFNPSYIKMADLDGSGITDLVYLGHDSFQIYFNQSGNGWSDANIVNGVNPLPFPGVDNFSSVSVIDLLGNGTGCIVWSSPLPQYANDPIRYIDLMGGNKPHILRTYKNNNGKEIRLHYKPSTFYYLADKAAGTPWVTKLPFPVQCISDVESIDQVRRSRFINQYSYHHGYYDFIEHEFRGFGRIDQSDTEDYEQFKKMSGASGGTQIVDQGFHEPPVLTRTWYHTGAFLDKEKIFSQFAHEYYRNDLTPEQEIQDPPLPDDLTIDEWRQALRACKGLPLRVEVYSPDGSDRQQIPYKTSHYSCLIQFQQPAARQPFAVFTVLESETLTYIYDRDPADPRVTHTMTIGTDAFGNVLKSATINYGRRTKDDTLAPAEQAQQDALHIVYTDKQMTNRIETDQDYVLPLSCASSTFELTGLTPAAGNYFSITEVKDAVEKTDLIPYQVRPSAGKKERRLIEDLRTLFCRNDLSAPLPFGVMESLALVYQSYKLCMTPGVRDFIFGGKVSDALLLGEGKYVHFDDDNYWIASGTKTPDPANFYQVIETADPFGFKVRITYDAGYRLFIQQVVDALDNTMTTIGFNYRLLSPYLTADANDNRSGVRADELGMVTGTFTMGKEGENRGDFMDTDLVEASVKDQPTTTLEYNTHNYLDNGKPNFIKTTARETHYYDSLRTGQPSVWQTSYTYVCGGGQEVMRKVQAAPGIALQENGDGAVTEVDTTPALRWIGNGRTLLNNKGNPVKQYEPYFSTTFEFEDAKELVERGVTTLTHYDPIGRTIRVDLPDGTSTKVEFNTWTQRTFDRNDTVLDSDWYRDRKLSPVPEIATPEEIAAANKAAAHANTPAVAYMDSLGRNFLSIADNGPAGKYKSFSDADIEGNQLSVTNALGHLITRSGYDMLGAALYHTSPEGGERWTFNDVMGKTLRVWDSRGHLFRYEYDTLHRPIKIFMQEGASPEINTEKLVYGETLQNAKADNLRGKIYQHFDPAGVVVNQSYDLGANRLQLSRQLCTGYKDNIDWNTNPALDDTVFQVSYVYNALNRPISMTTPDQSVLSPTFDEGNLLKKVDLRLKGAETSASFVKDIRYDVKGMRQSIVYGNDTSTHYQYNPANFRLTRLSTTGKNGSDLLQQLQYTYDPVGNITSLKDLAQPTLFFNNAVVGASSEYTYDALYRLIGATGREHAGQNKPPSASDEFRTNLPMPGDGTAMRNYIQSYDYDAAGNILQMIHAAGAGSWTRTYVYEEGSNRLKNNTLAGITEDLSYDAHGNILSLSHLTSLAWTFRDALQKADLGGGGMAYYVYDSNGQRVRKIIERQGGAKEERIYLGGFEIYRRTDSAGKIQEQTETLHVMDDTRRVALVETRTVAEGVPVTVAALQPLVRYQYGNHLGSASLELDDKASLLSYEEYYPYGATSYQAISASIQSASKRYRYTAMERDNETGLEYHSARYYLPWLGRWLSVDPIGISGGMNVYQYCEDNPCNAADPSGTEACWNIFASDCELDWAVINGTVKVVTGAGETVLGAGMVVTGSVSCPVTGVGCLLAAGGVVVMYHGSDTLISGGKSLIFDEDIDTLTSQGIQKLGVPRKYANMADGAIGMGVTMGGGAAVRSFSAARIAAGGEATLGGTASISIATTKGWYKSLGHNKVGVNIGGGAGTMWSDLVPGAVQDVRGLTQTRIAKIGWAKPPSGAYNVLTIQVPAPQAQAAYELMVDAVGDAGKYALCKNDCAIWAKEVLKEAGIATPPVTAPAVNYASAALQSPAVLSTVAKTTAAAKLPLAVTPLVATPKPAPPPVPEVNSTPAPEPPDFSDEVSRLPDPVCIPVEDQVCR